MFPGQDLNSQKEVPFGQLFSDAVAKKSARLNPVAPYAEFRTKPVEFAKEILGVTLEDYQAKRLLATADPKNTAIAEVSGNGPGKSFNDAVTALWFINVYPLSIVLEIEPTEDQIKRNFMAELSKLIRNAGDKLNHLEQLSLEVHHKEYKSEWFIAGKISNNPENVKSARSKYMMIIFGECQGIPRDIMNAARTRLTSADEGSICKRLATGNPGYTRAGPFYDIINKAGYEDIWRRFHTSCIDSPRVSNEFIKEVELEYGKESPEYLVMVLGTWPNTSLSSLCSEDQYNQAIRTQLAPTGIDELGLDVSRSGSHRTVLTHVNNGLVVNQWKWTSKSLMTTADECAKKIDALKAKKFYLDDTGLGGGVTDRLLQLGYSDNVIMPINFATKASQPDKFMNIKAEMLNNVSRLMEEGCLSLVNVAKDAELQYQLLNTFKDHETGGKRRVRFIDAYAGKTLKSCDELHSMALALLSTLPNADHEKPLLGSIDPSDNTQQEHLNKNFGVSIRLRNRQSRLIH